jgi:putative FmdB family regulatory protein
MPIYEFRCGQCADFEQSHPLNSVPEVTDCPACGGPARRRMSAPYLSVGGSATYRLLDETARSAVEPEVVAAPPPAPRPVGARRVPINPLHHNLPRP